MLAAAILLIAAAACQKKEADTTPPAAARRFRSPSTIPFGQRNTSTVPNTAFNGLTADGAADPAAAPHVLGLCI